MWTISINSAINNGENAHYDESCSSTLASTFSNGAKDPHTGVVCIFFTYELNLILSLRSYLLYISKYLKMYYTFKHVSRSCMQKVRGFHTTTWLIFANSRIYLMSLKELAKYILKSFPTVIRKKRYVLRPNELNKKIVLKSTIMRLMIKH